jgi:hypothetical protein
MVDETAESSTNNDGNGGTHPLLSFGSLYKEGSLGKLTGRVALITGGSIGIRLSTADHLSLKVLKQISR